MQLEKWTPLGTKFSGGGGNGCDVRYHRNVAMVLGKLADKLAGPRCKDIFDSTILEYLLSNLVSSLHKGSSQVGITAVDGFFYKFKLKIRI